MVYLNPEFQRNVWLNQSLHKLIATPLILFALLYMGYLTGDGWTSVIRWAVWMFTLVTIVYGAYLAGDSLSDEVQEGTWEVQRLTAIAPWTMTWGKLFGGPLYAWYVGLYCLLAIAVAVTVGDNFKFVYLVQTQPLQSMLYLTAIALFFHALSLAFNCIQLQKLQHVLRRSILVPIIAMVFSLIYATYLIDKMAAPAPVVWYHLSIGEFSFSMLSIAINTGWCLVAATLLMRKELQFTNPMWVWFAFLTYQCIYFIGFTVSSEFTTLPDITIFDQRYAIPVMSLRVGIVFLLLQCATYLMAVIEHIDVVGIRYAWQHVHLRGGLNLLQRVPRWLPTLFITAGCALVLLASLHFEGYTDMRLSTLLLALVGFMFRDMALFAYFDLSGKRRQMLAAFIYLLLLYWVLPTVCQLLHLTGLMPWFHPRPDYPLWYALAAPLLQAAIMWGLALRRFKHY